MLQQVLRTVATMISKMKLFPSHAASNPRSATDSLTSKQCGLLLKPFGHFQLEMRLRLRGNTAEGRRLAPGTPACREARAFEYCAWGFSWSSSVHQSKLGYQRSYCIFANPLFICCTYRVVNKQSIVMVISHFEKLQLDIILKNILK
jgi:hypothetical protein